MIRAFFVNIRPMKYLLTLLSICLIFQSTVADQHQFINRDIAEKAVALLNQQKEIIEWCACCGTKPKRYKLISAEIEKSSIQFVHINIKVKTKKGERTLKWIDLAYIHIKNRRVSECLAVKLGLKANPCTTPFRWRSVKRH